jgi:hypothetical protein
VRFAIAPRFAGIFDTSYELLGSGTLSREDATALGQAVAWFDDNLKAHAPDDERAVFWFKADARSCMHNVWAIVGRLQREGKDVRMLTTRRRPGRIVYEDAFQIAAIPHRDRVPTLKPVGRVRDR